MRRFLMILEFHGADFYGWQRQGPDRTVQQTVETAISDLTGHAVSVQSSGRTDRGVHALGMPAHVDVDTRLGPQEFMMAVNFRLAADVAIQSCQQVDARFHARFDAAGKLYRYTFYRSRVRNVMHADRSTLAPRPLNVALMRQAAQFLVGSHDFASFQTSPEPEKTSHQDRPEYTVDTVGPAAIQAGFLEPPPWRKARPDGTIRKIGRLEVIEDGQYLHIEVEGSGFLRGMVRAIAGTLHDVGREKQSPEWVQQVLESRDRRVAGANLAAKGLTLVRVDYPAEALRFNATP
ncbi:tRNA pseudouridine synthase A [Planctomycetota bacterium]|nr:tRNA pseudouridine synthase A [Planctomycetota bacterium]